MEGENYLKEVREQYENYPYPPRDSEKEKICIRAVVNEGLDFLNYWYFSGKKDFAKNFRVLVAGGGTGDSVVYLADQLHGTNAEVVYVDISSSSMEVAKERARVRALENITWVHASILDIPQLDIGEFDYINCSGVLHHLANPNAGLDALKSVLKEDGAMGVMLYAKYGRTPIYQMQELMTLINIGEDNIQTRVDNCKAILSNLPTTHQFNNVAWNFPDIGTDIGIYDLFLHSQDKAYSVIDLYQFAANSGLKLGNIFGFGADKGNDLYDPEIYIKDDKVLAKVKSLNPVVQQAIAEALNGSIKKHVFSLFKNIPAIPDIEDLNNVPSYAITHQVASTIENINESISNAKNGSTIEIIVKDIGAQVRFIKTPNIGFIMKYLDGKNTIKDIFALVRKKEKSKAKDAELLEEFKPVFYAFNMYNLMFLRHKKVPLYKSNKELQRRITKLYKDTVEV